MGKKLKAKEHRRPNPRLLSQFIPLESTLMALGVFVDPASVATPLAAECPLCRGVINVYSDIRAGHWIYCWSCRWAGSPLELAAAVWRLDILDTVRKLHSAGVLVNDWLRDPEAAHLYETEVLGYRKRPARFWAEASGQHFQDNPEWARLHDQLGTYASKNPQRWQVQMTPFVGACRAPDVAAMLWVWSALKNRPLTNGIFSGSGWHGLLTMPCHYMPGRFAGFWFVGRDGRWPEDWVFRRVDDFQHHRPAGDEREAGLPFLEAMLNYHKQFKDTAFVLDDPSLALAIHGRHFRDHSDVLPLTVYHDGHESKSQHVWQCLKGKKLIFWSAQPSRSLFAMARLAQGKISLEPGNRDRDVHQHMTWLRQLARTAVPWEDALAEASLHMEDPELESILLHLDVSHQDTWLPLAQKLPLDVRRRCNVLRGRHWPEPVVVCGHYRIHERENGWWVEQTGEMATNVRLRFTHVIQKRSGRGLVEMYYHGHATYQGRRVKIYGTTTQLRRSLPTILEKALVAAGAGLPKFAPDWRNRLLDIAIKFHAPRIIYHRKEQSSGRPKEPNGAKEIPDPSGGDSEGVPEPDPGRASTAG